MSYDPRKAPDQPGRTLYVLHAWVPTTTGRQPLHARIPADSPAAAEKRMLHMHPGATVESGTHAFGEHRHCAAWHAYAVVE